MHAIRYACWLISAPLFRKKYFLLVEDIDNSKLLNEKFDHKLLNHISYCPVPQQKHQIHYHHCYPHLPHHVLQFLCTWLMEHVGHAGCMPITCSH